MPLFDGTIKEAEAAVEQAGKALAGTALADAKLAIDYAAAKFKATFAGWTITLNPPVDPKQ